MCKEFATKTFKHKSVVRSILERASYIFIYARLLKFVFLNRLKHTKISMSNHCPFTKSYYVNDQETTY